MVRVVPRVLDFTKDTWDTEQYFDIIPAQDDDTENEFGELTLSGTGLTSKTVDVKVIDDDAPPPDDDPEPVPALPLLGCFRHQVLVKRA